MSTAQWLFVEKRVLVVFDINVYLDVARLMGPSFTWDKFIDRVTKCASDEVPHPKDAKFDSMRALALSRRGTYNNHVKLEVWSGEHIADTSFYILTLPRSKGGSFEWSEEQAEDFIENLMDEIRCANGGGYLEGKPTLSGAPDHEDGCVYATAMRGGHARYEYQGRFCITRDGDFRRSNLDGVEMMYPYEWIDHMRGEWAALTTQEESTELTA